MEAKRFSLVFPKGRRVLRGWVVLARKLRALDVELPLGFFEVLKANNSLAPGCIAKSIKEGTPFSNAVKDGWRGVDKVVWFQFGGLDFFNKMQAINQCLVGKWGKVSGETLFLPS